MEQTQHITQTISYKKPQENLNKKQPQGFKKFCIQIWKCLKNLAHTLLKSYSCHANILSKTITITELKNDIKTESEIKNDIMDKVSNFFNEILGINDKKMIIRSSDAYYRIHRHIMSLNKEEAFSQAIAFQKNLITTNDKCFHLKINSFINKMLYFTRVIYEEEAKSNKSEIQKSKDNSSNKDNILNKSCTKSIIYGNVIDYINENYTLSKRNNMIRRIQYLIKTQITSDQSTCDTEQY